MDSTPWMLLGITGLAAALRLYRIGAPGLWTDEAVSAWIVTHHSWSDMLYWVRVYEAKPPLYFLLLRLWAMASTSEGFLRLISALFGTLTVPAVYGIGRVVGGRDAGLTAALFMAISPSNVLFSQQVRMYSLLTLAAAVSILGQAWLLSRAEDEWTPHRKVPRRPMSTPRHRLTSAYRAGRGGALVYVLGTAAAVWVHIAAPLLPLAANGVVLLTHRQLTRRLQFIRNWIVAQVAVLAVCSPLISVYAHQWPGPNLAWISAPTPWSTLTALLPDLELFSGLSGRRLTLVLALEFLPLTITVCVAIWAWKRSRHWLSLTLGLWLLPLVGEITLTVLWHPVLLPRSLIWTSIPLYVLMAASVTHLRSRPVLRAVTLVMLLLVMTYGLYQNYWRTPEREAWRPVADYVARAARQGDLILFNSNLVQLPFDHYFELYHIPIAERGIPSDLGANSFEQRMTVADLPVLRSLATSHKRLWLVYSHYWFTDPHGLIPTNLRQMVRLVEQQSFPSREPILLFLYESRR